MFNKKKEYRYVNRTEVISSLKILTEYYDTDDDDDY
jgi:hypothetical protein